MKRIKLPEFSAIELLVAVLILIVLIGILVANVRGIRADRRDEVRKSNINSIFYQLESFYEKNNYYPEKINLNTLPALNDKNLSDPRGFPFNHTDGSYFYQPDNCKASRCEKFVLKATLEREDNFVKNSLND